MLLIHIIQTYLRFDFYILNTKKIMTKKTYMINHIPIKTSVTRRKYYIDKRCTKMGGWKIAKEPNGKKGFP
jgi:hypothetical protein